MKKIFIALSISLFVVLTCFSKARETNTSLPLKNVWKIQQIYYDSMTFPVDSSLQEFRMIFALDSIFYINDGKSPKALYWNLESNDTKISIYNTRSSIGVSTPFIQYTIVYNDPGNLILTLDVSNKGLAFNTIEYRLVPDPDFFNQTN